MSKPEKVVSKEFLNLAVARPEKYVAPYSHELRQFSDRIRDIGIRSGSQNRPGPLSKELDTNESELRYLVEKKLNACQFHYENELRAHIATGEKIELELKDKTFALTLQRLASQCRDFLPALLDRSKGKLSDLRGEELAHETSLNAFKKEHRRREPPLFPVSQKAHFTMLATIALAEALFNIAFYGEFRGIFTAALIAMGASLANVAVSAFIGTLWRFKNSTSRGERALGWFYFTLWISYIFYLNKFIASFRASLERVPAEAVDAISRASLLGGQLTFSYPWHGLIQLDITSWFLLIFGMIVAVAALLKGYRADDPYPQYGARVRRHALARVTYLAAETVLYETVDKFLVDAEKTVLDIADDKRDAFTAFSETAQAIYKVFRDYKIDTDGIVNDYVYLTKVYREANAAARSTPPPPVFNVTPKLSVAELRVPLRWQRKTLEKHRGVLNQVFRDTQAACAKTRKGVTRIATINRRVIRLFLRDVDKECERRREES